MKYCLTVVVFLFLFTASCGYQEGIVQKSYKSYLKFVGDPAGVTVQIDDMPPFALTTPDKVYQVSPGRHIVVAYRNGDLVVNRILFLDTQITTEVAIP